ncbi:hypothetical protein K7I13_10995 [Brucepastera parasyntrophica]|uniref:hypothetical protein n=1 Tax=Brucepastera parasyntrophica TaxID=2880008 RepID=UPI00210A240F|nr:hypothetical protein [Brucepastera parasyntrophica]ULQ59034.1 hypothetical protein K7I13_10995 [Brucepastera parasyntrophica]
MNKNNCVADRLGYSVFKITLPDNVTKNTAAIIKSKLVSVYPGPLEDKAIRIIRNGSDRSSRIVLVSTKEQFRKNHNLICSPIVTMYSLAGKSEECLFIADRFIEYITIKDGSFISSSVRARSEYLPIDEQILPLPAGITAVISGDDDKAVLQHLLNDLPVTVFADIPEGIKRKSRLSLFAPEHKKIN